MVARNHWRRMGITEFKASSASVLRDLESGVYDGVLITRRGKPVAEVTPVRSPGADLWGCLRGSVSVPPNLDLTEPVVGEDEFVSAGVSSTAD